MKLENYSKTRKILVSLFGAMSCFLLAACQHSGSYNLPAEHIPDPAGTRGNVAFNMQATKAEQYKYLIDASNWYADSITLSPNGQAQVEWMVSQLNKNPYLVYLEPSGNHHRDQERRLALVDHFELQGVHDADNFVIVSAKPFQNIRVDELD